MFDFNPEITIASKLPKYKGVTFTLRQMTDAVRLLIRLDLAEPHLQLRELAEQYEALVANRTDDNAVETKKGFHRITEEAQVLRERMVPARLKHLLIQVDGIVSKGEELTAANLQARAPLALYREIVDAMDAMTTPIGDTEKGESEPPTTSSEPGDGRTSNTGALTVVK